MQPFPLLLRCSTFWSMTLCFIYPTMAQVPHEVINSIGMKFVKIPKGTFTMGAPETELGFGRDETQHEVTISKDFYLGVFEVTQSEYSKLMEKNPSQNRYRGRFYSVDTDELPVEQVSWEDAVEFCSRLSESPEEKKESRLYRLPTEAEWEYACRAGTQTPFHFGATLSPEVANYNGNYTYGNGQKGKYRETTIPVKSLKAPNAWGLHHMHGNVWEWCMDDWHGSYNSAPTDGSAWIDNDNHSHSGNHEQYLKAVLNSGDLNKLLRGGSWFNHPKDCRSANRNDYSRDGQDNDLGFRLSLPRTI